MVGNAKRQSVAVVGLGSIGGIAAASLADSGRHDVTGCARKPLDRIVLERPERTADVPLRVLTDPDDATPVDWVLLVTKAHDTAASAAWLARLCGPATPSPCSRMALIMSSASPRSRAARPSCR